MPTSQKNQTGSSTKSNQHTGRSNSRNSGNFANMDEDKQREIASKGGKASHSGNSRSRSH